MRFSKISSTSFLIKIDISFILFDSAGLLNRLSKPTRLCKWVWAYRGTHDNMLVFQRFCINCNWLGLCKVSRRYLLLKFFISNKLTPSSKTMFYLKLLIRQIYSLAILSFHHSFAYYVCCKILLDEGSLDSCVKVSFILLSNKLVFFFL